MKKLNLSNYVHFLYVVIFVAASIIAIFVFKVPIFNSWFQDADVTAISAKKDINSINKCYKRSKLNGVCTDFENDDIIIAVMIENHVDARPQSGLVDATVVYEAPVEANYSRFLALFPAHETITKAGPVRSARPYFLDWVQEYDMPLYLHVGGSPAALTQIKQDDVVSVNEMTRGWYFWRDKSRFAPHNTYTSSELWDHAVKDYSHRTSAAFTPWKFDTDISPCKQGCVNQIDITFLAPDYVANWVYNTNSHRYERKQGDDFHIDQDGRLIVADTIIVQHVSSRVLDSVGRQAIDTIGSGEVEIYQKGHKIVGTWKKATKTGRTSWYDAKGDEIAIQPGKIWVEVVNQRGSVKNK